MIPFNQALFDTTFDYFITKRVAKVIWVVNMILIFLGALVAFGLSLYLSAESFGNQLSSLGLAMLAAAFVGVPLVTLLMLIIVRLAIEASIALISIAENTLHMRPLSEGSRNSAGKLGAVTQTSLSDNELAEMEDDFENAPNDFALDVLGTSDHKLWIKAGKPDLKPWIRLGLPDFASWLRTRA